MIAFKPAHHRALKRQTMTSWILVNNCTEISNNSSELSVDDIKFYEELEAMRNTLIKNLEKYRALLTEDEIKEGEEVIRRTEGLRERFGDDIDRSGMLWEAYARDIPLDRFNPEEIRARLESMAPSG